MKRTAWLVVAAFAVVAIEGAPAAAADKAHQQLMAEIRMLQEQQQQLQQLVGGLADALKTVTAKIDDQTGANRKGFADQKLLIDNVAEGVRILREKADDTNVRLSSVTQELESVKQAISTMPGPATLAVPGQPPFTGSESAVPGSGGVQTPSTAQSQGGPPILSAQKLFDNAFGDYIAGQYVIAIQGFKAYIASFPKSDKADDAQLNIGNSLYASGNFPDAVAAYQAVIANYPNSDSVPAAYYKVGLTYESLKQLDLARKAFEIVSQKYPSTNEAILAKQRLDSLRGK